MKEKNKSYMLYSVFPMYLAVIFSGLVFIPLVLNLVIDAIFTLVITFMFYKRFHSGFFLETLGISYLAGIIGVVAAVSTALLMEFYPKYLIDVDDYQQINAFYLGFLIFSFVIGTVAIFCINFFVNYGVMNKKKPWRKALKLWQRLVISISIALLNAPYAILFVRDEWLEAHGYLSFYNVFF